MNKFKTRKEGSKLLINNDLSRYQLIIDTEVKKGFWQALFRWELPDEKFPVFITARDFKNYDEDVQKIPLDSTKQYVEIGAGLGGFIPHLVSAFNNNLTNLPIVIDPANYNLMKKMLNEGIYQAKKRGYNENMTHRLETLIGRCKIFTDNSKVNLINTSLKRALSTYPKLKGIADFVIENRGSHYYPQIEFPERENGQDIKNLGKIHELRDSLLKQGGKFVGG